MNRYLMLGLVTLVASFTISQVAFMSVMRARYARIWHFK